MRPQNISKEETEMMRQAYLFLAHHCNPPPWFDPEADEWWHQAAMEVGELDAAWSGHPLIRGVLIAVYDYIGSKAVQAAKEESDVQEC